MSGGRGRYHSPPPTPERVRAIPITGIARISVIRSRIAISEQAGATGAVRYADIVVAVIRTAMFSAIDYSGISLIDV
jgi:hypothetical protein